MATMKIGISTDSFFDREASCVDYHEIRKIGFDCVDINHLIDPRHPIYSMKEAELKKYIGRERDAISQTGLEPYQFHAVWPTNDTSRENREAKAGWLIRDIVICGMLGCHNLVYHPDMPFGWGKEDDAEVAHSNNVALVKRLLPFAEKYNVTLCLENMPFKSHTISTVSKTAEFIDEIHHKNLGMCFDTGHAILFGHQSGDMVRLIGHRLKALHVHDNDGNQDLHLPPFEGIIDWEDFRVALREIEFSGCLSLECYINTNMSPDEQRKKRKKLAETAAYLASR